MGFRTSSFSGQIALCACVLQHLFPRTRRRTSSLSGQFALCACESQPLFPRTSSCSFGAGPICAGLIRQEARCSSPWGNLPKFGCHNAATLCVQLQLQCSFQLHQSPNAQLYLHCTCLRSRDHSNCKVVCMNPWCLRLFSLESHLVDSPLSSKLGVRHYGTS
jgi:hypothetical protein